MIAIITTTTTTSIIIIIITIITIITIMIANNKTNSYININKTTSYQHQQKKHDTTNLNRSQES